MTQNPWKVTTKQPSTSSGVPSLLDYNGLPQHFAQGRPPTYQQYGRPAPQPFTSAQFANSIGLQPVIEGYGTLKWLSARAGVMVALDDGKMVSFQEKEFCYKNIPDLRDVLRVGFILKFRATLTVQKSYVATSVLPIVGPQADAIFKDAPEIDLDPLLSESTHQSPRYSRNLEYDVYSIVLMPFASAGRQTVQLSSIHTEINVYRGQEVWKYVGDSIQKRIKFLEIRTHLFEDVGHDTVKLQHPAIYDAVVQLTSFLLRRGGVTSINDLYDFFCNHLDPSICEYIGHVHSDFTKFLQSQRFAFATFVNFVSARRNFPDFDYLGFVQEYFPTMLGPEKRREDVHYHQQTIPHHNEMRMYQQLMVMAHQSVPRNPVSTYGSSSRSSSSSRRTGSIFGGHAHFMEPSQKLEPTLNSLVGCHFFGSSSNTTEPIRPRNFALFPPETRSELPDNFPPIPDVLAMGDKVMRGFSLPEVTTEPSKEHDELCAEFETYLQVVQTKESSSRRIGHPNCTCKCTCGFMKPGSSNN